MHKFFVTNENIQEEIITIIGDDAHHLSKVLRLREKDKIEVSNGSGIEYTCTINEITKKEVICRINEIHGNKTEAPIEITLFQGIPKSQKMDLIVQKCVEIGVVRFYPVITDRVIVKTEVRDISGKIDRWNRISSEAAKQSNRGRIPVVEEPITFNEAIDLSKTMDLCIIPYENEKNIGLKDILKDKTDAKKVGIFIGPEGGFEAFEVEQCLKNSILPVSLGPRILRTETAGFVAATIVQYALGDMGIGGNK